MHYWVYGVDGVSREPREPLYIEGVSEEEARAQAKEMGMAVEEVEAVQPKPTPASAAAVVAAPSAPTGESLRPETDHPVPPVLVKLFRVLAGVAGLLYLILFFTTLDAASKAEVAARRIGSSVTVPVGAALVRIVLEAVLAVSLLLAVAEFLRLGVALERNTRGRTGFGEKRRSR
jgi:hypothetical protein